MADLRRLGVRPLNRPTLGTADINERCVVDLGVVGEIEIESDGLAWIDVEDRTRIRTEFDARWFDFEWVKVVSSLIEHSRSSGFLQFERSWGGDLPGIGASYRRFTCDHSVENACGEVCPIYRWMRTVARIQS